MWPQRPAPYPVQAVALVPPVVYVQNWIGVQKSFPRADQAPEGHLLCNLNLLRQLLM